MDGIEFVGLALADIDEIYGEILQALRQILILAGIDIVILAYIVLSKGEILVERLSGGAGVGFCSLVDGHVFVAGYIIFFSHHGGHGDELVGANGTHVNLGSLGGRRSYRAVINVNY